MPQKKYVKTQEVKDNSFLSAIQEIKSQTLLNKNAADKEGAPEIVDVITFCNDPAYLDLPSENNQLKLWISQRVILKCFYMGSIGNEKLTLTKEEWDWLYSNEEDEIKEDIIYKKNIKDVIRKMLRRVRDNNMPYFKELHLVLGRRSSKCREENERISTTEGSLTFRELCDRLATGERIGINTYDPKTLKRSLTYDIKARDNGIVNCYSVTTKRGISETSSWNHPYLVWRKDWLEPKFVKLYELLPGDKIAIAEKTELFGKGNIGINRAALLGHLQGDGGTTNCVGYSTASPVMLKDFERLVKEEFPGYTVKYKSKYDYCVSKNTGKFKQNGSQKNEIKEWLKSIGCFGKKSINKEVPDCIYKGSKEEVSAFLSRLFGCDGWCSIEGKCYKSHSVPRGSIGYCSSSYVLISGVRHLLQKYGIHPTFEKHIVKLNGKSFDSWKLIISRKECVKMFAEEISIFSKEVNVKRAAELAETRVDAKSQFDSLPIGIWEQLKKIMAEKDLSYADVLKKHGVGHNERIKTQYFPSPRKVYQYGKSLGDKFLTDMGSSDVKWDEVKSVECVGNKKTVDMEVAGTHIIGGDIISHNTLLASIITTYEAYKLLVINNGDPHGYYNLPQDDEIAIINMALSQQQAGRLFGQVQSRIRNSPFFKGRVSKETMSEIRLMTKRDMEKRAEGGVNLAVPGSILLLCGHSNPDSLAGYSTILILFDEIAFFDETGKVTGKYFYGRLKPSLSKFFKYNAARIVQISSPNTKGGIFYETFEDAKKDDDKIGNGILSFQLPTWCMNPDIPYDNDELARDRLKNLDMFTIEYGAQWAEHGAYVNYFDPAMIDRCVRGDLQPHKRPEPGCNYYMHIDPAKKSANYAAVMVAKRRYTNNRGEKRVKCFLAGIWIWRPIPGVGLLFNEIDKEVIKICSVFRPLSVTYDDYQSVQSIQLLRSHGINTKMLQFNRGVKQRLYQNLYDLMNYQPDPELQLYDVGGDSSMLIGELKNLKKKYNQRGVTIMPNKDGDVKTDDVSDCLAGACVSATDGLRMGLPAPVTVRCAIV